MMISKRQKLGYEIGSKQLKLEQYTPKEIDEKIDIYFKKNESICDDEEMNEESTKDQTQLIPSDQKSGITSKT